MHNSVYSSSSWDKKRVVGLFLSCDADASRTHVKKYSYSPLTFIEPDEEGRNPFFVNSVPVTTFHWRQFRGSVTPVGDLSKHSEWKYNEKKFRPSSDEKIEWKHRATLKKVLRWRSIWIGDMVCHVYHLLWIIAIAIFIFPSIMTLSWEVYY